ncbi:hypothetical protein [Bacillus cereus]|uniref:hypothetical protein n=1 Tax=Bacillus cereus TaxID=1396 RepID=UPI0022EC359F|nr:hypothetical protein [Bacillus cereus]MDA4083847.1 hypothetical protein [Bacillus cereus]
MINYIDPIPHIVHFFKIFDVTCYGNTFPKNAKYPSICVKIAGGKGFTRLQVTSRSEKDDIEAMNVLINAINILECHTASIRGIQVQWCEKEGNPTSLFDTEANKPQAWCYMRLEHLEA